MTDFRDQAGIATGIEVVEQYERRIAELEAELKEQEASYTDLVHEAEAMEEYIPKLQEEKRQVEAERDRLADVVEQIRDCVQSLYEPTETGLLRLKPELMPSVGPISIIERLSAQALNPNPQESDK